jgi:6-phosphogluconolactonase
VSPVDADGVIRRAAIQVVPTGRNPHSIQPDRTNHFVYATSLGSDQIMQFRFDAASGQLSPNEPPIFRTRPGDGPRHFVFSPDNAYLYVLHELSGTIAQLAIDPEKGTLTAVDMVESVPPESGLVRSTPGAAVTAATAGTLQNSSSSERPSIRAADIQMTPDGRFLYTTERTSSRLAMFAIAARTGKLTFLGNLPTVTQPRGIKVDPSGHYLVASGEKSDTVAVYRIDDTTGRLSEVGRYPGGKGANWVEIIDLP